MGISVFYPDIYCESTYLLPYEKWFEEGIRGLIFDIDNTLVEHDAPATERAVALMQRLKAVGFRICLVSNNDEERVAPFAGELGVDYVVKARKPSGYGYSKAVEVMKTSAGETYAIGDQLFTDVWGAHRAGLTAVLVEPISPKEEIQIILKRKLERPILKRYFRKKAGKQKET